MTYKKIALTVAQTAVLMAILTLGSKFIGFIREMVMANYYGTSYITDAFVMSNSIPGILFGGIVASIATAYMPVFAKAFEIEGQEEANRYTNSIINMLLLVSLISSVTGILFSDEIVKIFAMGFKGETAELTSFFLKISFSYIFATSFISILNSYLKYRGSFIPQIITGYSQSIFLMIFIVISAYTKHYYLIIGYVFAYIFQAVIYLKLAKGKEYKYALAFNSGGRSIEALKLSLPVFIVCLVDQLGQFVDKSLASTLPEGSVSALNYGILITTMISGLTITIMATIIFPKLNQLNALKNFEKFGEILGRGISIAVIITIPCALGAILYREQIVQVIYERGAFDPAGTKLTAVALWCYAIGLPFNAINVLLGNALISMHNSKTPAIISSIVVSVDIAFNFILIGPMAHGGLALSTSIGAMTGTILYYFMFKKRYKHIASIISPIIVLKVFLLSVTSVGASWLLYQYIILPYSSILASRSLQLIIAVGVSMMIYYILLKVFKFIEIDIIKEIFKHKA